MRDTINGSHRPLPYFEWWYFHFVTDNGIALNMVLHETDIFGLQQKPYISLSVCFPNKDPQYFRHDLSYPIIERGNPYLGAIDGIFRENAETICFNISFPGRCHFRGEIAKLSPPLILSEGILYQETGTGRSSHWLVQVPHASFRGILELDGVVHRLQGMAYQDHQWGDILIQEFVSDWVWGHFSDEEMAMVFFHILTQKGRLIERVALLTTEGRYEGTALTTTHLDTLFQARHPELYAGQASVSFFHKQCQVTFDISPACIMRKRLGEVHDGKLAGYLRWSAQASLYLGSGSDAGCAGSPLHGISEYIRIRPAMYGKLSD